MEMSNIAEKAAGVAALAATGVAAPAATAAAEEITASEGVEIISVTEEAPASADTDQDAHEIVEQTNDIRAAHGLNELSVNEELSEGSAQWAEAMSATRTVEHAEGDFGENLHWTSESDAPMEKVVQDWMDSDGHRVNILDPEATEIGTGVVRDENGTHSVQRFN
ncbi:CAP domain-containing protein [Corynebacterium lowii]|uniref:Cysteine-rich secretory protein family protein n=2 Tax=Corynebacterium lowii TaxID=1544413 RepID=A0A0Q0UAL3_9CORY|nr:CAP domain-containing protein [Corynebacterium lowii]KQB84819.1 Cysteine-rich secretory protein family protein [Corynebacterium lowii]